MKKRGLIQAGHVAPREPGFEGGTGTFREAEFATKLRDLVAKRFRDDGRFDITTAPGDLPDGWEGDFALYEHGDGSSDPNTSGMSFGYQTVASANLANRIRHKYVEAGHPGIERRDNYTADLHYYYGFKRTNAPLEVVIENGFMTNPGECAWLFANIDLLATAQYEAVLEELGMTTGPIRSWVINRKLTLEDIRKRNLLTIRRTLPTGEVTVWSGWRSDGTGANGVLRVLAISPEALDFRTRFDIAWQGHWFLQEEIGVDNVRLVAKSIWSRYSS